jgi:phosphoribosylaminoimidazolecarboxamide formyltransferase/IMP cyclohydrolase
MFRTLVVKKNIDIIFENKHFVAVNKPAGMLSIPDRMQSETSLKDILIEKYGSAFTVHRLDKETSGIILFAKDEATVGIGAGQMSRIDSTRIAVRKSQDAAQAMGGDGPLTRGAVLASDAFFPFADGIEAAAEAGASAIIQPGGAQRDSEVIAVADQLGLAMVFTGVRHFRH